MSGTCSIRARVAWAIALCSSCAASLWADTLSPDGLWVSLDRMPAARAAAQPWVRPVKYHAVELQAPALAAALARAPQESALPAGAAPGEITLPMPDGSFARFAIVEAPVMAPELAAQFPEIRTYAGEGVDDPRATVRLDWTPAGFHAQVLSPNGAVYIDPYNRGDAVTHVSYRKNDLPRPPDGFECLVEGGKARSTATGSRGILRSGGTLRTYRLAVAATGEYTAYHGGTVAAGQAAIVTAVNRVTGVYETELAIRLVLVANNHLLVFTNSGTDPYTNDDGDAMLTQNQTTIDNVIGSANYDIGHVFSTGGGGIAGLGVVCVGGLKAEGVTGQPAPVGDPFHIDYVAHEMGHQFNANHTFNGTGGSCSGNREASTAYEPGSASTIMGYAGICGASDNLQPNSDPYFHSVSFDEILAFVSSGNGANCDVPTSTGNGAPTVSAGPDYTIPRGTPFTLTAAGSDPNGDPLTFCWEERDLGPAQSAASADNGSSPLFRSFLPSAEPARTFPKLANILSNTTNLGEKLPSLGRVMNFRVTARDNRSGGGGVNTDDMTLTVVGGAGPFAVTAPNTAVAWSGVRTCTWNVANTDLAPIHCSRVDILLSTNGGLDFPITLACNVPNDGSQPVVLPALASGSARIKIAAVSNVFFDISDANFTLSSGPAQALLSVGDPILTAESCDAGNGRLDPGEVATFSFTVRNIGNVPTTNLVATLQAIGGVTLPSGPQNYGALPGGCGEASRSFTFLGTGTCGGVVSAVLALQDGGTSYGAVTNLIALGAQQAGTTTLANATGLTIPDSGAASSYPSAINVAGFQGVASNVVVRLFGFTHTWPDDVDILLVGPGGQSVMLMSDVGGGNAVAGLNLTFATGGASLPNSTDLSSTTYAPGNFSPGETLPSPAPSGSYGTSLATFNGLNPNGAWSLYVHDDAGGDSGSLSGGWSLSFNAPALSLCCSSVNTADLAVVQGEEPDPVLAGATLTYEATVSNAGPSVAFGVSLTNVLPPGVMLVSATPGQGTCSNVGGTVVCDLGLLSAGQAVSVEIKATPPVAGLITNRVSVAHGAVDPEQANNAVTTVTEVIAVADSDGDGILDAWEQSVFGDLTTANETTDYDQDGSRDREEFLTGSHPTNPLSLLVATDVLPEDAGFVVRWQSESNRAYLLTRATNLLDGFVGIASNLPATHPVNTYTDAASRDAASYRIELQAP